MNSPATHQLRINLDAITARMNAARARRGGGPVTLLPITKDQSGKMVAALLKLQVWSIGENRVQDARRKYSVIEDALGPDWKLTVRHLVGHLQTNKAKDAVELFEWVMSIDSLKVAEELQKEAAAANKTLNITLQVKYGKERTKKGMTAEECRDQFEAYAGFANLKLRGLMIIPPLGLRPEETRAVFRQAKTLYESSRLKASRLHLTWDTLSMGMSADYDIAIEEGATQVRIGQLLFHSVPEDVEEPKIHLDILD